MGLVLWPPYTRAHLHTPNACAHTGRGLYPCIFSSQSTTLPSPQIPSRHRLASGVAFRGEDRHKPAVYAEGEEILVPVFSRSGEKGRT